MRRLELLIQREQDGKTVETLLRRQLRLSGSGVRRARAVQDGILLDGRLAFTTEKVRQGQQLSVAVGDTAYSREVEPAAGPLEIRYEDEDLLILDKSAGTPVHPGPGHHGDTLADTLTWYYQRRGLVAGFHPVNRLDKGTSGLMAVAKHAYAHERLQAQLHTGAFQRTYLAVCEGVPRPEAGVIDLPIARAPGQVLRREVREDGASARTRYRTVRTGNGRALVALELDTGRTHQIRVHLAHLGCPLAGDFLYGRELSRLPGRLALHACSLRLMQPITGANLTITSPLPPELSALLFH